MIEAGALAGRAEVGTTGRGDKQEKSDQGYPDEAAYQGQHQNVLP